MNRRVDRIHIDRWIDKNKPDGIAKLAVKSGVSIGTIAKVRMGYTPRKQTTRERFCETLGIPEDILFPALEAPGKRKATG